MRIIYGLKRVQHTKRFWIPKYIAEAFDSKTIWFLIDKEEIGRKCQRDIEPAQGDQYAKDFCYFKSFKETPYGQKKKVWSRF
jgi:hypothetical protein